LNKYERVQDYLIKPAAKTVWNS